MPAPFEMAEGIPYLEVHHVKPLAIGGSDTIMNAVALCPNCHRRAHYGIDAVEIRSELAKRIDRVVHEP
jgi:5-methylcytosine-specific restriction enzyme A